jgi:hypothetical protein
VSMAPKLRGVSDLREFFRTNQTPIYFVSPTAFRRWGNDWHPITSESEAFYLRIMAPGDYRYRGADLGALVTRGRLQTDDNRLEERCKRWITGFRAQFAGTPLSAPQLSPASSMIS